MTVDDLLALRRVLTAAPSPDGRLVVLAIERPRTERDTYLRDRLAGGARSDLWLVHRGRHGAGENGEPIRLTDGRRDASGAWHPVWSPDGARLAFLSTRSTGGPENVRLWVWDAAADRFRPLSRDGVDLRTQFASTGGFPFQSFAWLDDRTLITQLLPPGETPYDFRSSRQGAEVNIREWIKAFRGLGPTASVLESTPGRVLRPAPGARLVALDVVSGDTEILTPGRFGHVLPSPDGRWLALVSREGLAPPDPETPLQDFVSRTVTRVGLLHLESREVRWIDEISGALTGFYRVPHRWSRDSRWLSLQTSGEGSRWVEVQAAEKGAAVAPPDVKPSAALQPTSPADRPPPKAPIPREARLLSGGSEASPVAVYLAQENAQTSVWTAGDDLAPPRRVLTLNRHLAQIADPQRRTIRYESLEGESLEARLLLPAAWEPAHGPLPLVTRVYSGHRVRGAGTSAHDKRDRFLNPLLLTGEGYAVLTPSMPHRPGAPWSALASGVLPAVDRVIELGIADPDRLGLLGHSRGGYTVYGLLTQTDRFRAAVAIAGPSHPLSDAGTLPPAYRADPEAWAWLDRAQGWEERLGTSPWDDPRPYLSQSPVNYLDRIRTPLLILHGDLDHVPLQQAEEVFLGLYRLGRPARLVRYRGEAHVIETPANLRDLWREIFDWLKEHLATGP